MPLLLFKQVKKLTTELEQVKGSKHCATCHRELNINPIDIAYLSSHEDHED